MGKNQNTWSHRTQIIFREIKIIFQPLGSLAGFPARATVLWHVNVRGTRNASVVDAVTMATAKKRFHVPSEAEIDKLSTDKDSMYAQ